MRAHSAARSSGNAARTHRTALSVPMSNVASHSSSSRASKPLMPTSTGPAALTSPCSTPHRSRSAANAAETSSALVRSARSADGVRASRSGERGQGLVEALPAPRQHGDPRALRGQALRRGPPHPLRAPAHGDGGVLQSEVHDRTVPARAWETRGMTQGHTITIEPSERRVQVIVGGETLADTAHAILLHETGLRTRYYLPREDVRMDLLMATDLQTTCPFKGDAQYWSGACRRPRAHRGRVELPRADRRPRGHRRTRVLLRRADGPADRGRGPGRATRLIGVTLHPGERDPARAGH